MSEKVNRFNRIKRYLAKRFILEYSSRPENRKFPFAVFNDRLGKFIMVKGYYNKEIIDTVMNDLAFDTRQYACLDIGANVGNYTVQYKDYFNEVHSFEPQIRAFKLLSLNTDHLDNVKIYNFGLSDIASQQVFKVSTTTLISGSLHYSDESYYEEHVTLKAYDEEFDHEIAYVRLDVAGHEIQAIQGMKHNLMKYKPVITFDYDIERQKDEGLLELLESLGYTSFWVPKIHFIERKIPSNKGPLYFVKLFARTLNPYVEQELVPIDLRKVSKLFDPHVTTFHPDSKFKLKHKS